MRPFRTREEAIIYFVHNNPMSQCDYFIEITTKDNALDSLFALQNFNFPQGGIQYNNEFGFPHPVPVPEFGPLQVTYIPLRTDNIQTIYQSNFNQLWADQFTLKGLLRFIPAKDRPIVSIYTYSNKPELLLKAVGCVFTYPTPSISYSADTVSVNSLNIYYEDAELYTTRVGYYNPNKHIYFAEHQIGGLKI